MEFSWNKDEILSWTKECSREGVVNKPRCYWRRSKSSWVGWIKSDFVGEYDVQSTLFCFVRTKTVTICNGEPGRGWRKWTSVLGMRYYAWLIQSGKSSLKHPDGSTASQTRLQNQSPVRLTGGPLEGAETLKGPRRAMLCPPRSARGLWLFPFPS